MEDVKRDKRVHIFWFLNYILVSEVSNGIDSQFAP